MWAVIRLSCSSAPRNGPRRDKRNCRTLPAIERIPLHARINILHAIGSSLRRLAHSLFIEVVELTRRVDGGPIMLQEFCLSCSLRASAESLLASMASLGSSLSRALETVEVNVLALARPTL